MLGGYIGTDLPRPLDDPRMMRFIAHASNSTCRCSFIRVRPGSTVRPGMCGSSGSIWMLSSASPHRKRLRSPR